MVLKKNTFFLSLFLFYEGKSKEEADWFVMSVSVKMKRSQNHRMLGIGRDLERSSSPIPLPEQEHLYEVTRECVQRVLNVSRVGDSTHPLGSRFQCSVTLTEKKFLLKSKWNLLCSCLNPLPLVLALAVTEKSLAPSS